MSRGHRGRCFRDRRRTRRRQQRQQVALKAFIAMGPKNATGYDTKKGRMNLSWGMLGASGKQQLMRGFSQLAKRIGSPFANHNKPALRRAGGRRGA